MNHARKRRFLVLAIIPLLLAAALAGCSRTASTPVSISTLSPTPTLSQFTATPPLTLKPTPTWTPEPSRYRAPNLPPVEATLVQGSLTVSPKSPIGADAFALTMTIPELEYQAGEQAVAKFELTYNGPTRIVLRGTAIGPFNLLVLDESGDVIYDWQVHRFGPWPVASPVGTPLPINPGDHLAVSREFILSRAGELRIWGTTTYGEGTLGFNIPGERSDDTFGAYRISFDLPPIKIVVR